MPGIGSVETGGPEPIGTGDARAVRTMPGVTSHYLDGSVHTPTRVPIDERARYVRLQVADGNVLELTEIQVWGKPGTP